jgi:hypothetical protein
MSASIVQFPESGAHPATPLSEDDEWVIALIRRSLAATRALDLDGVRLDEDSRPTRPNRSCAALAGARAVFRCPRRWAVGGPTKRRVGSGAVGLQKSKINDCALTDAIGARHVETCTRRDVLWTRSSVAIHYAAAAPTSVPTAPVRAGQDPAIGHYLVTSQMRWCRW